jgi:hypothetical protein
MDVLTLAEIFSVRKGYIYRYTGSYLNQDPAAVVTEQLSLLLKRNDFVSSVTEIKGQAFVYINEIFPEDTETAEFILLGSVEEALTTRSIQQEEYLRSLQPAPEPTPEPEEPQNAD